MTTPEVTYIRSADGSLITRYRIDDIYHRDDGPAYTVTLPSGVYSSMEWLVYGKLHRVDGPAVVENWDTGIVNIEEWWVDDVQHRLEGPAQIEYDRDGSIITSNWYVHGTRVEPDDFPSIDFDNWPLSEEDQLKLKLSYTK